MSYFSILAARQRLVKPVAGLLFVGLLLRLRRRVRRPRVVSKSSFDDPPVSCTKLPLRDISCGNVVFIGTQLSASFELTCSHLALVRGLCTKDESHSAGVARIQRGELLGPGDGGLPPYLWIKPGSGGFITQDAGPLGPPIRGAGPGRRQAAREHGTAGLAHRGGRRRPPRPPEPGRCALRPPPTPKHRGGQHLGLRHGGLPEARRDLFDPATLPARDVERYGTHEIGRHVLMGRRLLEAGATFVKVNSNGWDTHGDTFNDHVNMIPKIDRPFAALIENLAASGRLEHTPVVAMSEFGRTPRVNGHVGQDHSPEAWSLAMSGYGTRRGTVLCSTNAEGTYVTGEELDIGHLFHTWFRLLGIDPAHTESDNDGQPLAIAHEGCHPVEERMS